MRVLIWQRRWMSLSRAQTRRVLRIRLNFSDTVRFCKIFCNLTLGVCLLSLVFILYRFILYSSSFILYLLN